MYVFRSLSFLVVELDHDVRAKMCRVDRKLSTGEIYLRRSL
jgi:hypothetical protein